MKAKITEMAIEIHADFMMRDIFECPSFYTLLAKAENKKDVESTEDMRFLSHVVDQLMSSWDEFTSVWIYEEQEVKSQQRYENANRGEM
jgi:hypothetical protein